jgi:di/tricarboxylate transporter
MSKVDLAKWIANFAIPLAIALIPCGEVFTMQMKLFFVTTIFAILCFALETMDSTGVAILLPIAWVFFGVATPAVVFGPWNQYIAWVTLSGLFLANVLQRIGLLSRFTFWVVSKTGINYRGILIGMAVASMIITSFIGEHPMLLATIAYGICLAFDFGKSKASAGIMLTTAVSVITAGTFRFAAILTPLGVAKAAGINADLVGFFESWYYNMPMILFWLVSVLICIVLFKPEKEIEGKAYFEQKLAEMGPISKDEIRGAMVLFIFIGYIMTQKIHGLSLEWGMALIPWILLFPGVGCATKQDVNKINYGMAFFIIACMGIGSVATSLGLGALVQAVAGPLLSGKSVYVLFAGIWILLFLGNFVMTPLAMIAAFTVPFLNLAAGFGVNPVAVLHFMVSSYDQIVFPYEYAKYLMFFAFGVISMSDFMKFGIVKTIAHIIIAFGILIPWWMFTGFLYV